MPLYWGSLPIPGSDDTYSPTPTVPGATTPTVPGAPAPGLSLREIRNLFPHMTRRELRALYPEAPTPGSGLPGGVTRNEIRNSIPDSTKYFSQINPRYTQASPIDAFAPMRMFQQYERTGQLPGGMSSPAAPAVGGGGDTGSGYTTGGK